MSSPSEPGAPAPGWYDDAHGSTRWWDGFAWTEHVTTTDAPPPATTADAAPKGARTDDGGVPAPAAAPAPRPSRLWVVWVVVGAILLGVVIALAVLIPQALLALPAGSGASASPSPSAASPRETSTERAEAYLPSTQEEQKAADVLDEYQQAWWIGDCEAYLATTETELREGQQFTDCETFVADTRLNVGWNDDFTWTISSMEHLGTVMTIYTTESYTSRWDVDAEAVTDEPVYYEYVLKYTLTSSQERWTIRDVVDVSE